MTTRFKLIAAALGLVVATGAIGDASAKTINKTIKTHKAHVAAVKTTKVIAPMHRVHIGTRILKPVRLVHRAPLVAVVKRPAPLAVTKVVRFHKAPLLQRHARVVVKKTIIR